MTEELIRTQMRSAQTDPFNPARWRLGKNPGATNHEMKKGPASWALIRSE
jgi:hypothetical protein